MAHCLQGRSLLLTGLPAQGTHLARRIVEQLREAGDVVQLVSKTHCAAQNGLGAQTADHWVSLGRCGLRGASPGPAWRGTAPLKDSDLLRDLAGGYCHELTENRRTDERIFQFISWLRVGEAEEVPLRLARREFPRPAGQRPDVCLSNARRVINERENRRLEHQAPGAPTTDAPHKVAKGTFVRVAEADAQLLRHTRLCHAIT